jgi:large subunit ribosomal protein L9
MKVFMLKDVEKVGMMGSMVTVADGFAMNFLFPRKLALEVTDQNTQSFRVKIQQEVQKTQVVNSKIAMMAERINALHIVIKEKTHDDGKLYGAVGADEIVQLLKDKEISIDKKQVEFDKNIKSIGEHKVTIKLSSKLKPQLTLKVVALAK